MSQSVLFGLKRRGRASRCAAVLVVALLGLISAPWPVAAATSKACYTPAEFQADQALYLYTELMVIGLKCQEAYRSQNPFGVYQDFNARHATALKGWQQSMAEYFHRASGGNGTRQFDTWQTSLANDESRRAAAIGNTEFCAIMVPLARQVANISEADLRRLIEDDRALHLAAHPPCGTSSAFSSGGSDAKPEARKTRRQHARHKGAD